MMELILLALGMALYIAFAIPVSVCIARHISEKDNSGILNLHRN